MLGIVPQAISCIRSNSGNVPTTRLCDGLSAHSRWGLSPFTRMVCNSHVDEYWRVVLPATYLCFTITLFVRALPPRLIFPGTLRFAFQQQGSER